jgi:hypothetical protein
MHILHPRRFPTATVRRIGGAAPAGRATAEGSALPMARIPTLEA